MKNWIIGLFLLVFSVSSFAQVSCPIDIRDLTEEQVQELQLKVIQLRKSATENMTAEKISEYTLVGQQISQAIITVAEELEKSVDDVLNTTTGKVVIFVVLWKVIGPDLIGFGISFLWFLTMIPLWMYYFQKFCVNYRYIYRQDGKIAEKYRIGADDASVTMFVIAALIIVVVGIIMAFG